MREDYWNLNYHWDLSIFPYISVKSYPIYSIFRCLHFKIMSLRWIDSYYYKMLLFILVWLKTTSAFLWLVFTWCIFFWCFTFNLLESFIFYVCFLQAVCNCVCMLLLQSCLTLCSPMDCSLPDSSLVFFRQEWVAMPSSRGSSPPSNGTHVCYVACIFRQVLYH